MAHEVRLEVFEGPIDLLLHLITRQRVDIYDVSLATITEEYLSALERMEDLDLESATGFLVVAATLLELKSVRLLPTRALDDADAQALEERDLLLARLIEVSTFREAGAWVAAELAAGGNYLARTAGLEPPYVDLVPDLLARLDIDALARAAGDLLAPAPVVVLDTSHVAPIKASVRDAIVEVAGRLSRAGELSFEELCSRGLSRIDVVVRFLALLELFKAGAIDLDQADRFGAIRARWSGEVTADDVAAAAEEYTLAEEV